MTSESLFPSATGNITNMWIFYIWMPLFSSVDLPIGVDQTWDDDSVWRNTGPSWRWSTCQLPSLSPTGGYHILLMKNRNHLGWCWNPGNKGIFTTSTGEFTGFFVHQQYVSIMFMSSPAFNLPTKTLAQWDVSRKNWRPHFSVGNSLEMTSSQQKKTVPPQKSVNTVSLQRISFFTLCTGSFNPHARSNLHLTAGAVTPKTNRIMAWGSSWLWPFLGEHNLLVRTQKEKKKTPNQIIKPFTNFHPLYFRDVYHNIG